MYLDCVCNALTNFQKCVMQEVVYVRSVKDQKKEFEEQKDEKALDVIAGMLVFLFPETSWSLKMTRFRNELENRKWRFFEI